MARTMNTEAKHGATSPWLVASFALLVQGERGRDLRGLAGPHVGS